MNHQTQNRIHRHKRVRTVVRGTSSRPRLSVYRSNQALYVQLIDDDMRKTLVAVHSREITDAKTKLSCAEEVGRLIANKAKKHKITRIVFDRGGYKYHGRIKAVADSARAEGLVF
jgi:large subunit ribosomal protein L18